MVDLAGIFVTSSPLTSLKQVSSLSTATANKVKSIGRDAGVHKALLVKNCSFTIVKINYC